MSLSERDSGAPGSCRARAIIERCKHVGERITEISEAMRRGSWVRSLIQAQPAARRGGLPPLRYFEEKYRSRTTEYQCPAMSSALPAIESVINSIVSVLPWVSDDSPLAGVVRTQFQGAGHPAEVPDQDGDHSPARAVRSRERPNPVSRAGSAASGNRSSERRCRISDRVRSVRWRTDLQRYAAHYCRGRRGSRARLRGAPR
jgi:hypothetical protein